MRKMSFEHSELFPGDNVGVRQRKVERYHSCEGLLEEERTQEGPRKKEADGKRNR